MGVTKKQPYKWSYEGLLRKCLLQSESNSTTFLGESGIFSDLLGHYLFHFNVFVIISVAIVVCLMQPSRL